MCLQMGRGQQPVAGRRRNRRRSVETWIAWIDDARENRLSPYTHVTSLLLGAEHVPWLLHELKEKPATRPASPASPSPKPASASLAINARSKFRASVTTTRAPRSAAVVARSLRRHLNTNAVRSLSARKGKPCGAGAAGHCVGVERADLLRRQRVHGLVVLHRRV